MLAATLLLASACGKSTPAPEAKPAGGKLFRIERAANRKRVKVAPAARKVEKLKKARA